MLLLRDHGLLRSWRFRSQDQRLFNLCWLIRKVNRLQIMRIRMYLCVRVSRQMRFISLLFLQSSSCQRHLRLSFNFRIAIYDVKSGPQTFFRNKILICELILVHIRSDRRHTVVFRSRIRMRIIVLFAQSPFRKFPQCLLSWRYLTLHWTHSHWWFWKRPAWHSASIHLIAIRVIKGTRNLILRRNRFQKFLMFLVVFLHVKPVEVWLFVLQSVQ